MPNSKLKCKQCKQHFPRLQIKQAPIGFCGLDCVDEFYRIKAEKQREKALKAAYGRKSGRKKGKTKAEYDNDLKTRKKAAKEACHAYIRERDKYNPCICCGEPLGEGFHAGHFWESGNFPFIRYHEDNIHGQRVYCNTYKGGDSGHYKENLIKKIGAARVEWLDENKRKSIKRTAKDYAEIEQYYKQKLKDLIELRKSNFGE